MNKHQIVPCPQVYIILQNSKQVLNFCGQSVYSVGPSDSSKSMLQRATSMDKASAVT